MKLYLVRHAPVDQADGLCYGRTDLAANADATLAAARHLGTLLPAGLHMASSPLQRCTALASAIAAQRPDLAWQGTDARLQEMDFGQWENRSWLQIGQPAVDCWLEDFSCHAPGGGESVADFMARVQHAWQAWIRRRHDGLWITHAGVIRAAMLLHRGLPCPARASDWPADAIAHGHPVVLDIS